MTKLVLLRHGESVWNKENRFTGWVDVTLSPKGEIEASDAGKLLKEEGFDFDIAFTSLLKRATKTLNTVLDEMDLHWLPVIKSWRLNERHYGALQGLNKAKTVQKYGEKQVLIWRRSYDTSPPSLDEGDDMSPANDRRYSSLKKVPMTENLKLTVERFLPFLHESIFPTIKEGKRPIIVAHGNSLRALVKYLDNISDKDIVSLNIPTGIPLIYELDDKLKPIKSYYLGDADKIKKAADTVANQGKAKGK